MRNPEAGTHCSVIRGATAAAAACLFLLAGCGSDDDTTSTTTTVAAEEANGDFPSDEFCAAQADLEAAQDGAQRNTAIGEMQSALGEDAPAEVVDALDTLLEGDLAPEQYSEAEQALAEVCD
jgi:hypothetical protein